MKIEYLSGLYAFEATYSNGKIALIDAQNIKGMHLGTKFNRIPKKIYNQVKQKAEEIWQQTYLNKSTTN